MNRVIKSMEYLEAIVSRTLLIVQEGFVFMFRHVDSIKGVGKTITLNFIFKMRILNKMLSLFSMQQCNFSEQRHRDVFITTDYLSVESQQTFASKQC